MDVMERLLTELALDHPERMLDFGVYLGRGFLDPAPGSVQLARLVQLLVGAAANGERPYHFPPFVLRTFVDVGSSVTS
jgi:hypothetical protein